MKSLLRHLGILGVMWCICGPVMGQMGEAELKQLITDREIQLRDLEVQIQQLEGFVNGYPAKEQNLEHVIEELESMHEELEAINQRNLLVAMLQLAYETYSTLDSTANLAKGTMTSLVNRGAVYAAGEVVLDQLGGEVKKQMGLDESSYYSARTVSLDVLSKEALAQSAEVGKIQIILNRSLADIQAEVFVNEGEEIGERGAVFRKNLMLREQINTAVAAVENIKSSGSGTLPEAQTQLDWCLGEKGSLKSSIEGLQEDYEKAVAQRVSAETGELAAATLEAAADFSPAPPGPDVGPQEDDETDYEYAVRRYNAVKSIVDGEFFPVFDAVNEMTTELNQTHDIMQTKWETFYRDVRYIVAIYKDDYIPRLENYGTLSGIAGFHYMQNQSLEKLKKGDTQLSELETLVGTLEELADKINDKRAMVGNLDKVSQSAPHPNSGPYYPGTMTSVRNFRNYAEPWGFSNIAEYRQRIREMKEALPDAVSGLSEAIENTEIIFSAVSEAYVEILETEKAALKKLDSATRAMASVLDAAENLGVSYPEFCEYRDASMYRMGYSPDYYAKYMTMFSHKKLNDAMAKALKENPGGSAGREIFDRYLQFLNQYNSIFRSHGGEAREVMAARRACPSGIPTRGGNVERILNNSKYTLPAPYSQSEIDSLREQQSDLNGKFPSYVYYTGGMSLPVVEKESLEAYPLYPILELKERIDAEYESWMELDEYNDLLDIYYEFSDQLEAWRSNQDYYVDRMSYTSVIDQVKTEMNQALKGYQVAHSPPRILNGFEHTTLEPGETLTLQVKADRNPESFQWYQRSIGGYEEAIAGATGHTYTVTYSPYIYSYYCEVSNEFGSSYTNTVEIDPFLPPEIAYQPESVSVSPGEGALLEAQDYYRGILLPTTYQWYSGDPGSDAASFEPVPGAVYMQLKISAVSQSRAYFLRISNEAGVTDSDIVNVNITGDPSMPLLVVSNSEIDSYAGKDLLFYVDVIHADGMEITNTAGDLDWLRVREGSSILAGRPTAQGTGSVTLRPFRDISDSQRVYGSERTLNINVYPESQAPPPRGLMYFGQDNLNNPEIAGPAADPDGDGIPNLLEYFHGTSPVQENSGAARVALRPLKGSETAGYAASFTRSSEARDLPGVLEILGSEGTWTQAGKLVEIYTDEFTGQDYLIYRIEPEDTEGTDWILMRLRAGE